MPKTHQAATSRNRLQQAAIAEVGRNEPRQAGPAPSAGARPALLKRRPPARPRAVLSGTATAAAAAVLVVAAAPGVRRRATETGTRIPSRETGCGGQTAYCGSCRASEKGRAKGGRGARGKGENLVPAPRATRVQHRVPARVAARAALACICAGAALSCAAPARLSFREPRSERWQSGPPAASRGRFRPPPYGIQKNPAGPEAAALESMRTSIPARAKISTRARARAR